MGSSSFSFSSARHFDTAFPHLLFFFFSLLFFFFFPPKNNNAPQRRRHHFARPTMGLIRSLESKKMEMKRQKRKKKRSSTFHRRGRNRRFRPVRRRPSAKVKPVFWSIAVKRSVLSSRLSVRNEMRCSFFLSFFFLDGACISLYQGRQRDFSAGPNARAPAQEREEKKRNKISMTSLSWTVARL